MCYTINSSQLLVTKVVTPIFIVSNYQQCPVPLRTMEAVIGNRCTIYLIASFYWGNIPVIPVPVMISRKRHSAASFLLSFDHKSVVGSMWFTVSGFWLFVFLGLLLLLLLLLLLYLYIYFFYQLR